MNSLFPKPGGVASWHGTMLGGNPFPCDRGAAALSFFRPAARLCRKAVPAERTLPASIPPALLKKIGMALRFWQVSQEITENFVLRDKLLPGMDMPMTLNFAMALGNYSRFLVFSGDKRIPAKTAAALHAAFVKEMTEMPPAMAARRAGKGKKLSARDVLFFKRHSPEASALRLAAACAGAFK